MTWSLTNIEKLGELGVSAHIENDGDSNREKYQLFYTSSVRGGLAIDGLSASDQLSQQGKINNTKDLTIVTLKDGKRRAYYIDQYEIYTALISDDGLVLSDISSTGISNTNENKKVAWGVPDAVVLPDGRVRLYWVDDDTGFSTFADEFIISATSTSTEGTSFSVDEGKRVENGYVDFEVLQAKDNDWIAIMSSSPETVPAKSQGIYIGTSNDGLTWKINENNLAPTDMSYMDPTGILLSTSENKWKVIMSESELVLGDKDYSLVSADLTLSIDKTYSGNFRDYKFYNKGGGVYKIKASSESDTLNFFKSGEVKDGGSGDIVLTFQSQDENFRLDVGGNRDETKGFISLYTYSYDSSQDKFVQIDASGLQNGNDYRGTNTTRWRGYWIDEWNGTDSLRFDFTYINSTGTEYLDHYYLELIDGTHTFSNTPTNSSLLGIKDINETDSGLDNITGYQLLRFTGEEATSSFRDVSAIEDIKGTFDQVTGLNTDSGKMFRLYNAAFARFPDSDGLKYWIGNFSSGKDDERAVASSFLASAEFKQRYGENVSDSIYVNTLYKNVLGRDADTGGLNYWLGQLNSGAETRYEVLLGFSESAENKGLFTEMTGLG